MKVLGFQIGLRNHIVWFTTTNRQSSDFKLGQVPSIMSGKEDIKVQDKNLPDLMMDSWFHKACLTTLPAQVGPMNDINVFH